MTATLVGGSIDELVATEPAALDDDALRAHVRELEAAQARVDAHRLVALRELSLRQVWADDGAANPAAWVTHHTGLARQAAGSVCNLARVAPQMPDTVAALAEGAITSSHVRVLARCVGPRTAEAFANDEPMLVDKARRLTADQLAKVVAYWLAHVDHDGAEPPDPGTDDRAHLSRTLGGRWRLDAEFGSHTGTELNEALRTKYDELWRADQAAAEADPADPIANRTPSERRAAALLELVGLGAATDDTLSDRRRPSYIALIDGDTLHGATPGAGSIHETTDGGVLDLADLELDRCDCMVGRVIWAGATEPVDLGRLTRTATPAQRRALIARDRGCRVRGCDRPPAWCDAHHIHWWQHGGATNLNNLILLCRHHHRRVHTGHLTIHIIDGHPQVRRADGTPIPNPRGSPDP